MCLQAKTSPVYKRIVRTYSHLQLLVSRQVTVVAEKETLMDKDAADTLEVPERLFGGLQSRLEVFRERYELNCLDHVDEVALRTASDGLYLCHYAQEIISENLQDANDTMKGKVVVGLHRVQGGEVLQCIVSGAKFLEKYLLRVMLGLLCGIGSLR